MHTVPIPHRTTVTLDGLLDAAGRRRLDEALAHQRAVLAARRRWHVNSTAAGGGVAEMLGSLLPVVRGAGVDVSWLVLDGDPAFFTVTKRLHNHLHEDPGDGGPLGGYERSAYAATLGRQHRDFLQAIGPGDVAVLHDPQTAGLAPLLRAHGAHVVWRAHVGTDAPGPLARSAWGFLLDDVRTADAAVFTRAPYVWEGLAPDRVAMLPPCIDVASPKNQPLTDDAVAAILDVTGIVRSPGEPGVPGAAGFRDADGHRRSVSRPAVVTEVAPVPPGARLVTQVSRWDRLKDPTGLVTAFAVHGPPDPDVHLMLVGPLDGVADDPESAGTFEEVRRHRQLLAPHDRRRVHLVRIPMDDPAENAVVVNAVQRRSDVVVQKSLAEGFGLTVAEAMWKGRPVVASRVGGIRDQIVHGESGLLVDDPADLAAFGAAIRAVLGDPERARRLGRAARGRVAERFLAAEHVAGEADVIAGVLGAGPELRRGRPSIEAHR